MTRMGGGRGGPHINNDPPKTPRPKNIPPENSPSAEEQFARFGIFILNTSRERFGDIDGGMIQDQAEKLGLLHRVRVTEPCSENCACEEYDSFPQECLRLTEEAQKYVERSEEKQE